MSKLKTQRKAVRRFVPSSSPYRSQPHPSSRPDNRQISPIISQEIGLDHDRVFDGVVQDNTLVWHRAVMVDDREVFMVTDDPGNRRSDPGEELGVITMDPAKDPLPGKRPIWQIGGERRGGIVHIGPQDPVLIEVGIWEVDIAGLGVIMFQGQARDSLPSGI